MLLKTNIEMNNKYNSFYDLTKLKCIYDEDIILLEKKVKTLIK